MPYPLDPVRLGLIGAGRIGSSHARLITERVPGAVSRRGRSASGRCCCARRGELGGLVTTRCADEPRCRRRGDRRLLAVHAELIVAAAAAGKAVFCEKPMALALADVDRAIAAAERAGVVLQVGFNRRFAADFAAAHARSSTGALGTPQLMRSLTRDPGPRRTRPASRRGRSSLQTLIHDFDTLLLAEPGRRAGRGVRDGRRAGRAGVQGRPGCWTPPWW